MESTSQSTLEINNLFKDSILLLNKAKDWTSFDVVNKVRRILRGKKVGHAGTLDPAATGLLILCTGSYTKKLSEFQNQEKEYTGVITLGQTTPSFDSETAVDQEFPIEHITTEMIISEANKFVGEISQIPPNYSAIKVNGERSYKKAREGKVFVLEPRKVHIREFEITQVNLPEVSFRVVCSKGTYIRSLANDLGKNLGAGAFLSALVRTRIGDFLLKDALTVDGILKLPNPSNQTM